MVKKIKLGLALGSGTARGYAHIPIINFLIKNNVKIDMISGSSAGAIIGAYFALYGEVKSLEKLLRSITKKESLHLIDLNNPKKSIIKGIRIKKYLEDNFFGSKTFKDTKIPLYISATNIKTKKVVYFNKGKIIDAVMASISVPAIFPP